MVSVHSGAGPSRCMACGQFAGDGHVCPPRVVKQSGPDRGGAGGVSRVGGGSDPRPTEAGRCNDLEGARQRLAQARIAVGLAVLRHRQTGDRSELDQAIAERSAAAEVVARAESTVERRCPSCGQFADDGHTCPTPEGMPEADYAGMVGEARTKAMLADLQQAVAAVAASGQMGRWLDAMASNGLNRWSMNNRILALSQLAARGRDIQGAHLMGFRSWEKLGRHVGKGEKAIWILAPMTRRIRDEEPDGTVNDRMIVTGFKSVPVFDVSQTAGADLPAPPVKPVAGEVTPGTLAGLQRRVADAGYSYREVVIPGCDPARGTGKLGYTDPDSKQIVIDSRLAPAQKASVIAHELGHVHCGHVADMEQYRRHRGRMETEAEMTAYMVNRARGMDRGDADSFSPGYIAGWSGGDPAVVTAAMDRATKAFNKIMDGSWEE